MTSTNRQTKENIVTSLTSDLVKAKSVTLVDFAGLNISAQQELKKRLKTAFASMVVVKNTLIKIAVTEAKLPKEMANETLLSGQTAVIVGNDDPVSPIQTIGKFASENEALKFKAGVVDGEFMDKETMVAVSKLPGKDVLVGQTVGSIASPMYGLIANLQASIQELLGTLSAKVG